VQEIKLYEVAVSGVGTMGQKEIHLRDIGVFDDYKRLHKQYLALFDQTTKPTIKLEALKRLTFLNWYALLEPSCFTGINELDEETVCASFERLNTYLLHDNLDNEFRWMLSYYSSWDWILLAYAEPKLSELTAFVKSVDNSISHFKQNRPEEMVNRGQMGIYWQSHGIGQQ
jgi:hypothetical protein